MTNHTDDAPRTRPPTVVVRESQPLAAPEVSPEFETSEDHEITQESFRAIMSANQRGGRWESADEIRVHAILGEVTLDFRQADLPPSGVIEIEATAIGGEVRIIVPDGAEVELAVEPFIGSIEQQLPEDRGSDPDEASASDAPPQPPTFFRISARAIAGTVKVIGR